MTSKVVCAEYATNEKIKILDRKIYDEGILSNIKNAINFIEKRIKLEFVIKSVKRIEIPQYPEEAYREMILSELEKKRKSVKESDKFKLKQKILRFAQSRGYELEIVNELLE